MVFNLKLLYCIKEIKTSFAIKMYVALLQSIQYEHGTIYENTKCILRKETPKSIITISGICLLRSLNLRSHQAFSFRTLIGSYRLFLSRYSTLENEVEFHLVLQRRVSREKKSVDKIAFKLSGTKQETMK